VKRLEAALKTLPLGSMFTSTCSNRTVPTYRSPNMTTRIVGSSY